jgi:uncharacterized membrane protein
MRSWRSAVFLALAACTGELAGDTADAGPAPPDAPPPVSCDDSVLRYSNFGEPFVLDWCRGCHSAGVPDGMRQGAPEGVDFDTHEQVATYAPRILARATGAIPSMPPAGGPSDAERAWLAEWLACGAR